MKKYLVTVKPEAPYFFGNEKTFLFPKNNETAQTGNANPGVNRYFIKSELVPSQTTLLGALRYLFLPVKKSDFSYTEEKRLNAEAVGESGYFPGSENTDGYGKIKAISPVFVMRNADHAVLVPVPLDHNRGGGIFENTQYTPFKDYHKTADKQAKFTDEFDVKVGTASGMLVAGSFDGMVPFGEVIPQSGVFGSETRVGNNRSNTEDGFFKKQYAVLDPSFTFAFLLDLDADDKPQDECVFLGQGKSPFLFRFEEITSDNDPLLTLLNGELKKRLSQNGMVYCLSDAFLPNSILQETYFAAVKTKTYRFFSRTGSGVSKGDVLYNLVAAGSVFMPKDNSQNFLNAAKNDGAHTIGYNTFIDGGTEN